jgi:leucyl/phenylalanyl-tRNA---protein transferase
VRAVLLEESCWFPDPGALADDDKEGLIAIGGDLSVASLLLAYRSGIFPWSVNPITWWSPNPRGIFELNQLRISRSLARTIRKHPFEITYNQEFRQVIEGCANQERPGSWISPEFVDAYCRLHVEGHAHSVECWKDSQLAGGIYGVAVGGFFAGESMFTRISNSSKIALYYLFMRLLEREFKLFDIQMLTPVTASLGAVEVSRTEYLERLAIAVSHKVHF